MIDFAEKAVTYTEGKMQAEFVADPISHEATRHNLRLNGEEGTWHGQAPDDAGPLGPFAGQLPAAAANDNRIAWDLRQLPGLARCRAEEASHLVRPDYMGLALPLTTHAVLDAVVARAYCWDVDISEVQVLEKLLVWLGQRLPAAWHEPSAIEST